MAVRRNRMPDGMPSRMPLGMRGKGKPMHQSTTYHAGVDGARHHHCVYLATADGQRVGTQFFPHRGEGLRDMATWLRDQTNGGDVTATIEVPHGPVVTTMQHDGIPVPSINPLQLHHSRQQRAMSGAKDDVRDAWVMTEVARTTPESLRPQPAETKVVIALRLATQQREQRVADRTACITRWRNQQWEYFPGWTAAGTKLHAAWFLDLCKAVPTPQDAVGLTPEGLDAMLPKRAGRRPDSAKILATLQTLALPIDPHVVAELQAGMLATVAQIEGFNAQIAAVSVRIDHHMRAVPAAAEDAAAVAATAEWFATTDPAALPPLQPGDLQRLQTIPGVGDTVLAVLVAHGYGCLARRDRRALRCLAGVAPVTLPSGRMRGVRMRRAANQHLRNAMHAMGATAAIHDPASKNYDDTLRARGCSHGRAVRAVADRLLRIMFAMRRDGTDFDPQRASRWFDSAAQIKEENGVNES